MTIPSELFERATLYADYMSIAVDSQRMLGHGSDGSVWRTSRDTALKIMLYEKQDDDVSIESDALGDDPFDDDE